MAQLIAHVIAGHHGGLPDTINELNTRLRKELDPLAAQWRDEITLPPGGLAPLKFDWGDDSLRGYRFGFLGRMLFSCLVDADFRDTEQFYCDGEGDVRDRDWPGLPDVIDELVAKLNLFMAMKTASTDDTLVNRSRAEVLKAVRSRAGEERGIFTLTVPTGGGKTLASLAFALEHAKAHRLERIIYAIPYTSIIDQTASVFREVLGDDVVLEHHSSMDDENIKGRESRDKLRLAMEDWAAPVVVTTNVQLFESLHANRPSRCRKLHNLANSVIVLDEAQAIPRPLLRPCIAALGELTRNYGVSLVLCTATQPAVGAPDFKNGLKLGPDRELAPDPASLHRALRRVRLKLLGEQTDDQLAGELARHVQALVIVNSRAHALELYRLAQAAGLDGVLHLTTRQYAAHRRMILTDVRERLKEKAPCRLIATSLVEAGVDLDFPCVWRAEAGLDQIAQAAGRCNREGSRALEDSVVGIFRAQDRKPPHEIAQMAAAMTRILGKHADPLSPAAMRDYFEEVFWQLGAENLDKKNILNAFNISGTAADLNYRRVADSFRMIESGLEPVIVAREGDTKAKGALAALRTGRIPAGGAARDLQSFIVQVPPMARALLIANGHVRFVNEREYGAQFAELVTASLYTRETGLLWENAEYLGVENMIV